MLGQHIFCLLFLRRAKASTKTNRTTQQTPDLLVPRPLWIKWILMNMHNSPPQKTTAKLQSQPLFLILPTVSFSDWHLLNLPESAAATTGQRGGRGGFRGGGGRLCGGGGIHQVRPSGAVDVRTISSCGVSGVELLSHAAPQLPKPISISMEKAVCFIRFIHVFQFFF